MMVLFKNSLVPFFGIALTLAFFQCIEVEVMDDRDEKMASEIASLTDRNVYETILVTCGDLHKSGISSHLEEKGWDVEERTSDSLVGKFLLMFDRIWEALLHPVRTIHWIIQKGSSLTR